MPHCAALGAREAPQRALFALDDLTHSVLGAVWQVWFGTGPLRSVMTDWYVGLDRVVERQTALAWSAWALRWPLYPTRQPLAPHQPGELRPTRPLCGHALHANTAKESDAMGLGDRHP